MKHVHTMPFGASVCDNGGVDFSLWAPSQAKVVLELGPANAPLPHAMTRDSAGWHRLHLAQAGAGDAYRFRLPDGLCVPDPASRSNPQDIHAVSVIMDPSAYTWQHPDWRGRPWEEAVVYEMHVGTFTPEGTFAAAMQRLPALAELGITAVELMPVADFPGRWNWGYDGVLLFAPDTSYGTPDELKALVDTAHGLGMMVLLDVVYNHFGPEGNYLHAYCPEFFNPAHQTPWGSAINYDAAHSDVVRSFVIHNACYWVEEFCFDGLRLDAIHAIRDDSPVHIVRDICTALHACIGHERHVHVVLENDSNQATLLDRDMLGKPLAGTAQWNDDLHHAAHVLVTGEADGYYVDYADQPLACFGRALAQGFIYQGQPSPFRDGELRGQPCTHLPLTAFVSFLQTHDQVGNRAFGERLQALGDPVLLRTACVCVFLSPHIPMLFMGEEFAASTPFQYFCDFGPELAQAVSKGRRDEFGRFAAFADEAARLSIPDPNAESTFLNSKLRWEERNRAPHADWLAELSHLLALRQRLLVPHLRGLQGAGQFQTDAGLLRVDWTLNTKETSLHLIANFGAEPLARIAPAPGKPIFSIGVTQDSTHALQLSRGAVQVSLQEGGHV